MGTPPQDLESRHGCLTSAWNLSELGLLHDWSQPPKSHSQTATEGMKQQAARVKEETGKQTWS